MLGAVMLEFPEQPPGSEAEAVNKHVMSVMQIIHSERRLKEVTARDPEAFATTLWFSGVTENTELWNHSQLWCTVYVVHNYKLLDHVTD